MLNLANHDFEPDVMIQHNHFSTIIIGAGPAGLTAGIYLSRARAKHRSNNMGQIRTVITMVLIFLSLVVYSRKNDSVKVHLNH